MKIMVKSAALFFLGIFLSGSIVAAQEQMQSEKPNTATQIMKPVLTEEQRTMLKSELQKRKEIREDFRATLSQEQKDLLTDPKVVKAHRIKAFRASLSDQQVNMIKARKQEIKSSRILFRSTLTDQQKMQFKRIASNRVRMNRALFIRTRLRDRLFGI